MVFSCDYYTVPALVKTMVEGAPAALNWMIDEGGLQLRPITNRAGGHSACRTETCVDGVGRGYTEAIKKIAERNGAKIRLGSKVTGIWRKEAEGPVLGLEVEIGMKKGRFLTGATIADLAAKADIPPKVLEETIKKHDQYLAGGKDPEFNKPITPKMVSLTEGPYYAVAQWPAVHHTMGGLRINEKAQVLDIWGKPIPKLYAAGEIAGGAHGSNRLGSNATPDCIVFGRIAGIHAAMEKA